MEERKKKTSKDTVLKSVKASVDEWVPILGDDDVTYEFFVEPTQEELEKARKKRKVKKKERKRKIWITQ